MHLPPFFNLLLRAQIALLRWLWGRYLPWPRRVLMPSLVDFWHTPPREHVAKSLLGSEDVRNINLGKERRRARRPGLKNRLGLWLLEIPWLVLVTIVFAFYIAFCTLLDGTMGGTMATSISIMIITTVWVLERLVGHRELAELLRRNKEESDDEKESDSDRSK